jgi:putative FmdB family regulatory protein
MPTYRYVCSNCGEEHEEFQSMSAEPLRKCPHCGKNGLERKIGPGAGFLFKGDGFYITDYRSEGYKKAASSDAPAASSGSGEGASSAGSSSTGGKKTGKSTDSTKASGSSAPSKKKAAGPKKPSKGR